MSSTTSTWWASPMQKYLWATNSNMKILIRVFVLLYKVFWTYYFFDNIIGHVIPTILSTKVVHLLE